MIDKILFGDLSASTDFAYAKELDYFKVNKSIEFKPGLNIIFAPNGSGKSTILSMIAKATASEQGGVSTITDTWLDSLMSYGSKKSLGDIQVLHDGQPTMYATSRNGVGLVAGGAAFDHDFTSEGIIEIRLHESSGYTTMHRLKKVLNVLSGATEIPAKYGDKTNGRKNEYAKNLIQPTIAPGQKTILLDEPESGLAIHVQANIWRLIDEGAKKQNIQVIAATHSPFCLISSANFIELSEGYMDIAKKEIENLSLMIGIMEKMEIYNKKVMSNER